MCLFRLWFSQGICPGVGLLGHMVILTSQVALLVKNLLASAGDIRDANLIPESERSPGGGHGSPLQYSSLENPMNRGAWRAMVCRVAKSQTRRKLLSMDAHTCMVVLFLVFFFFKESPYCSP